MEALIGEAVRHGLPGGAMASMNGRSTANTWSRYHGGMDATNAVTMTVVEEPSEEELRALIRSLVRYNESRAAPENARDLAVFVRAEDGALLGGAMGYTHWEWLFVSHLWVDERLRGHGWGGRLMASLEEAAVRRGCHSAHLDTFSFQALGFYEKHGYARFGTLPDYPRGESRYFLCKRLAK